MVSVTGGAVAWEIACQLNALGREVEFVVLFNTGSLNARFSLRVTAKLIRFLAAVAPKRISEKLMRDGMGAVWSRGWQRYPTSPYAQALRNYVPSKLKTRLIFVLSEEHRAASDYSAKPWANLASEVHCKYIAGTHQNISIHIAEIAHLLDGLLTPS